MSLGLLGPCEVQAWTDQQGRSRTETLAYDLLLLAGRWLLRGGSCRSVRVLREHGSGRGFLVPKGTELSAKEYTQVQVRVVALLPECGSHLGCWPWWFMC